MPLRTSVRAVAALLVLVAACGGSRPVVVGSKAFTEQRILGELIAQTIEAAGVPVKRRLALGDTFDCDAALRAGRIDTYVEYTGTALRAILHEAPRADPAEGLAVVKEAYAAADLAWMRPLGFENSYAVIVRGDDAAELHLAKVSDIGARAGRWNIGVPLGFAERTDGVRAFGGAYGIGFAGVRSLDPDGLYDALVVMDAFGARNVDVVIGNATDGKIARHKLAVLEDDQHFFGSYQAVPIVRRELLRQHPELTAIFDRLGGAVLPEAIRRLNWQVDGEHESPADAVRAFRQGPKG